MGAKIAVLIVFLGGATVLGSKLQPSWERSKIETLEGEKMEIEHRERDPENVSAAEKDLERVQEIEKEVNEKETALKTKAKLPFYVKLGGAGALALGLVLLIFAGSQVERGVAIFVAAVVLPGVL